MNLKLFDYFCLSMLTQFPRVLQLHFHTNLYLKTLQSHRLLLSGPFPAQSLDKPHLSMMLSSCCFQIWETTFKEYNCNKADNTIKRPNKIYGAKNNPLITAIMTDV